MKRTENSTPDRRFDFQAFYDVEGTPVGYGATPEAALASLAEVEAETKSEPGLAGTDPNLAINGGGKS